MASVCASSTKVSCRVISQSTSHGTAKRRPLAERPRLILTLERMYFPKKKTRGKRPNRWLLGPGRSGHHVRGHTEPECLGKAEHDHNDDFHKNPPMTSPKVGKIITALFEGFYPKISENLDPPSTPGRVTTRIITLYDILRRV